MPIMKRSLLTSFSCALALAFTPAAPLAQAQTPAAAAPAAVSPADAKPYLGDWTLAGESQMGPFTMALSLKVEADTVGAVISSEMQPATPITDITKGPDGLVLRYTFSFDGNSIPTVLALAMKEDKLDAQFTFGEGAFQMGAVGTKAAPATPAN